jgi:Rod binding domain-containing protein
MNIPPAERAVRAADLSLEKLAVNTHISQEEKVAEVSRQFEAVLLRQIIGQIQKPIFASKFSPDSFSAGIYRDTITSTLADSISKGGTFGLAKSLQSPLTRELPGGDGSGTKSPDNLSTLHGAGAGMAAQPVLDVRHSTTEHGTKSFQTVPRRPGATNHPL